VEPIAANMGVVPPAPGFLEGLRAACDEVGALLIFDEVITGFRVAWGGAQDLYGVRPDLWTFGKVIGGGLPVGAFGGRADVMDVLAPDGPVYQAGTLSGNPLAMAAGLAAVSLLEPATYASLTTRAERLASGLREVLADAGLAVQVPVAGTLVGLFFGESEPVDYATARCTDEALYARFFHALLARGVALAPGAYEALFVGVAHTDAVLDTIVERADDAARSLVT
jgi:glutamate-1-semialdehyde 2,1-aminomutase